jgi:hypothetical protein
MNDCWAEVEPGKKRSATRAAGESRLIGRLRRFAESKVDTVAPLQTMAEQRDRYRSSKAGQEGRPSSSGTIPVLMRRREK